MKGFIGKALLLPVILVATGCNPQSEQRDAAGTNREEGTGKVQDPAAAAPVLDGPEKLYDAQGRLLMEGMKRNGQRTGIWTSYFPDGRERSRNEYRDGVLNGVTVVFRENGALYYTGEYRDGKEIGVWKFHDPQGVLERSVRYEEDGTVINDPQEHP